MHAQVSSVAHVLRRLQVCNMIVVLFYKSGEGLCLDIVQICPILIDSTILLCAACIRKYGGGLVALCCCAYICMGFAT